MTRILIIDGSAFSRELLAKTLEASGFTVTCACGSGHAVEAVFAAPPDLVILEPSGDPDAMKWLEGFRRAPRFASVPVIILTEVHDKGSVLRAGQLGVRDYILKQRFSLTELLIRIQRNVRIVGSGAATLPTASPPPAAEAPPVSAPAIQFQTSPGPAEAAPAGCRPRLARAISPGKCLTREQTLARVECGSQAKTLPGAVSEIMGLVNSPRGAVSDVAQALKRDPVLAARVLQLANSAAFMSQKPRIASVDEAVRNIGIGGVRTMIMSVGIFESFTDGGSKHLDILRFWQHSFAVAAIMEKLVPPTDAAPAGSAHLVGLCHELAELALAQQFPEEYELAVRASQETGQPVPQARSQVFGLPYHELAVALLRKLGLPPMITVPIEEVIERSAVRPHAGAGSLLARALRMADVYANGLMLPSGGEAVVTPLSAAECRGVYGTDPPLIDDFILRSDALTLVNMLSGVASREAANICKPPLQKSDARIWYARHAGYGSFDPLEASLRMAGEVETHQKPPSTASELEQCDVMVVAAARQTNPLPAQQQIGELLKLTGSRPTPIIFLSGCDPQGLSVGHLGRCFQLPVQLTQLVDALSWSISQQNTRARMVA
jgi:HD-like signal output (HDOD) protein/DNA-binding NarL/FixJ family response regulator